MTRTADKGRFASGSARLQAWFPDREFIMRSQGQVRFVRFSSRSQITGAGIVAVLALVWSATMAAALLTDWSQRTDAAEMFAREARIASAENRVAAYREGVDEVADDLLRRQDFIEEAIEGHLGALPEISEVAGVQDSTAEKKEA